MKSVLELEQCDKCICHCSQQGCYVIGCAVSGANWSYSTRYSLPGTHYETQPYIFALVDDNRASAWMSSAIFRILTFESLSLTHTCCYRIFDERYEFFKRPSPEEAQVINELELDDINLLDTLVAEFETKWAKYTKRFVTFMNRVWKPRMRAVRQERKIDKKTYQAELVRMGVTLKEPRKEEEEHSDSDSDSESDSDWPDDYESDGDEWYTTDDEGLEEDNMEENEQGMSGESSDEAEDETDAEEVS
jgi:hypothetical protein